MYKKYPIDKNKVYSFFSQVLPITENYSFTKINNFVLLPLIIKMIKIYHILLVKVIS